MRQTPPARPWTPSGGRASRKSIQGILGTCALPITFAFGAFFALQDDKIDLTKDLCEKLFVASMLHDIAITGEKDTPRIDPCFGFRGAREASALVSRHWSPKDRIELEEAICRHLNPRLPKGSSVMAQLMQAGTGLDYASVGYFRLPKEIVDAGSPGLPPLASSSSPATPLSTGTITKLRTSLQQSVERNGPVRYGDPTGGLRTCFHPPMPPSMTSRRSATTIINAIYSEPCPPSASASPSSQPNHRTKR